MHFPILHHYSVLPHNLGLEHDEHHPMMAAVGMLCQVPLYNNDYN